MKRGSLVWVFLLVAVLVVVYVMYQYAVASPYRISSEEARRRLQAKEVDLILDVRTDLERKTLGSYPGSVHIPSSDLKARMPRDYPEKNMRVLAYCNTGHRARAAADILLGMGYTNAVYIASTYKSLL
jgi:rhodanese-related sulfurtransferase